MNQTATPTFQQRVLATDWLPFGFAMIWTVGFVVLVAWMIRPSVDLLRQPGDLLSFIISMGIAGLVG